MKAAIKTVLRAAIFVGLMTAGTILVVLPFFDGLDVETVLPYLLGGFLLAFIGAEVAEKWR